MRKITKIETPNNAISVSIKELKSLLGCGECTAYKIGKESGAKFKIGDRSLYKLSKIEEYINSLTEEKK